MAKGSTGIEFFLTEIQVSNWESTVRWYVETLGMRLVVEDAEHQYAMLEAGRGRLALKGGSPKGLVRDHMRLIIQVGDLDAERDRLLGRCVAVGPPLDNPSEGYREVRLHDPEGTPIRLFCRTLPETMP
jgi:catechol 2,3-dioxygenase-like lactoylglutathione lyase family enzyme